MSTHGKFFKKTITNLNQRICWTLVQFQNTDGGEEKIENKRQTRLKLYKDLNCQIQGFKLPNART